MQELQNIDVNQLQYKPPNKSPKFLGGLLTALFIILAIGIRLALRGGFVDDMIDRYITHDREKAENVLREAVLSLYTISDGQSLKEYQDLLCSYVTADFCATYQGDDFVAVFNDLSSPITCTIEDSEYLETLELTDTNDKVYAYRIMYSITINNTGEETSYQEVGIMLKEGDWKLYELLTQDDYQANKTE